MLGTVPTETTKNSLDKGRNEEGFEVPAEITPQQPVEPSAIPNPNTQTPIPTTTQKTIPQHKNT